jgi:alcohol dehydrogenase class IV
MRFDFFPTPRIIFGPGRVEELGALLAGLGRRPLVVHNGPLPDVVARQLPAGSAIFRQKGEPELPHVQAALELARTGGIDCLLGLGGGSALDLAKATAAVLGNGGECLDYLEIVGRGHKLERPAFPWLAMPTTAGTGAEVARNAVITVRERGLKVSLRSELILPRAVLIDPRLQVAVPPAVTAASGCDALCQCLEAYVSRNAGPMTDPLALRGLELAAHCLPTACTRPGDLDARCGMALAALLSGVVLTNAGLGAVHALAAPLGAAFPAPHGAVCGRLTGPIVRANLAAAGDGPDGARLWERYAAAGRAMGSTATDPRRQAEDAATIADALVQQLNVPGLGSFGFRAADAPRIADLALQTNSMRANPVALPAAALVTALAEAS